MIADAAITTIAREGLRGFTHRAVDRAASLAEGSTSYYFRTREALMFAALARMAELDALDIGEPLERGGEVDMDALTSLVTALVWRWLTDSRERTLARYELTLESTRRPALRMRLMTHGAAFRVMAEQTIAAAGASEPKRRAGTLVAHLDGLLLHQLTRVAPTELDRREISAACRDLLTMALA
ncbi:TetR/AcrR family transcriptional regulator [Actinophytocola sp.]|uniref:TetR/AcrR family transcriptional regulator n=1 Tax=Actinophytocola sp. TaxID=1872138 RepID=UPI002ED07C1A